MEITVGIDLGTTFSVAAHVNEFGQAEEIVDQARRNADSIPSVVYYQNEDTVLVGEYALEAMQTHPEKVIRSAKRFMNEKFAPPSGVPKDETPVTFSTKILKAIKQYVEEHEDKYEIKNAVITVPAYFDPMKINLTKKAAEEAGIDVLGIINEPMAAAIYYCVNTEPQNQKFLVYDLGGGTFDAVIIEYRENDAGGIDIITLAQDGNHQLGGDDWDRKLMEFLLSEARKIEQSVPSDISDMDPSDRQNLWEKAIAAKLALTRNPQRDVTISVNAENFDINVTRDAFERETKSLLAETGQRVDTALSRGGLTEDDIDLVLLVGGSTFMPMVQNYVHEKFGEEKVKLNNPNLAVAYGAAIYADNLDKYFEINPISGPDSVRVIPYNIILNTPCSIGVRASIGDSDDLFVTNMIFLGEQYSDDEPIEREKMFSCKHDGGFEVPFYSNQRSNPFNSAITDHMTEDEYISSNADALIRLVYNPAAERPEEAYGSENTSDLLNYMASVYFQDATYKAGDPVKVTIVYGQRIGSYAKVEHVPTGVVKDCQLINTTAPSDTLPDNKKIERV